MFTSWYLSQNAPGVEKLFLFTLVLVVLYCVCSVIYPDGRKKAALKRSIVGLIIADAATEFAFYLGYMEYFPGYDSMGEPARMFPAVILPVIFFLCAWFFMRILNAMFR